MFIGKEKTSGNIVDIQTAITNKNLSYVCPICGEELIIKNGSIVTPHFAHKTNIDCDTFTHDMSEWHKWWQEAFPIRNREHVEELSITIKEYKKAAIRYGFKRAATDKIIDGHSDDDIIVLKHRADIRACGYIIEVQNSSISKEEFNERNWFYTKIGCKVVWIFNLIWEYSYGKRISIHSRSSDKEHTIYKWSYASKTLSDFRPQKNKNIIVFFQFFDEEKQPKPSRGKRYPPEQLNTLMRVSWAIPVGYYTLKDTGEIIGWTSDFKRFAVDERIKNRSDFFNAILSKKI